MHRRMSMSTGTPEQPIGRDVLEWLSDVTEEQSQVYLATIRARRQRQGLPGASPDPPWTEPGLRAPTPFPDLNSDDAPTAPPQPEKSKKEASLKITGEQATFGTLNGSRRHDPVMNSI